MSVDLNRLKQTFASSPCYVISSKFRQETLVYASNSMIHNIFLPSKKRVQYVHDIDFGDTFPVIKQTPTGFNDRTAKYKEEFVPLLQPVIIQVIDNSTRREECVCGINLQTSSAVAIVLAPHGLVCTTFWYANAEITCCSSGSWTD